MRLQPQQIQSPLSNRRTQEINRGHRSGTQSSTATSCSNITVIFPDSRVSDKDVAVEKSVYKSDLDDYGLVPDLVQVAQVVNGVQFVDVSQVSVMDPVSSAVEFVQVAQASSTDMAQVTSAVEVVGHSVSDGYDRLATGAEACLVSCCGFM